jgi:hypothetical protein
VQVQVMTKKKKTKLPILAESETAAFQPVVDLFTTLKPAIDATMMKLAQEVTYSSLHPMAGVGLGFQGKHKPFTTADLGEGEFLHGNVDCVGATILLKNRLQHINRKLTARKHSGHSSGEDASQSENPKYAEEGQKGKSGFHLAHCSRLRNR